MTITQMVQQQQQQRIGEMSQRTRNKPHVNPYSTPGMSLNDGGDYRKMVPVDEGVVQRIDRKSTRLNSSHLIVTKTSRMPSSA